MVDELAQSNLPEKTRAILAARAYTQLLEFEKAKTLLNSVIRKQPSDIELLVALADCHRDSGEPKEAIQALERAHQVDPKRDDLRRALALALVTSNPKSDEISWDRIASMIERARRPPLPIPINSSMPCCWQLGGNSNKARKP